MKKNMTLIITHTTAIVLGIAIGVTLPQVKKSIRKREWLTQAERQVQQDPSSASHWTTLGMSKADLRQFNEAIDCFKKAIEIDPNDLNAYTGLSMCYWKMENGEEAEHWAKVGIEQARQHQPGSVDMMERQLKAIQFARQNPELNLMQ